MARAWIGTPYFPCEAKQGRGCDCGSLLAAVYAQAGIIPRIELAHYDWTRAWAVAGGDAYYLGMVTRYAHEINEEDAGVGDIVMYRVGKGWSHGGIIIRWPGEVVHAMRACGVVASPGVTGFLAGRQRRFFSPQLPN